MQTEIALEQILPTEQSQQNFILKKMVCQQRNKIAILEEEMQKLQVELNSAKKIIQNRSKQLQKSDDSSQHNQNGQGNGYSQEDIQQINQKMENEFVKLKNTQIDQQNLITQYKDHIKQKDMQIDELVGQLKSAEITHRGHLEEAQSKINKSLKELDNVKKQLYYAECNNKRITQDANKKISELKSRLQVSKAQLKNQTDLLHQQQSDIQLYQNNYKQIYDTSTSENIRKLIQQIQDLESQLNEKNQNIQQLTEKMKENEIRAQKTLRDQLQEQQLNLQTENKQKIQEIIQKSQQQAQYMKEITDQQVQQLKNEINELVILNQEINQQQKQLQLQKIQTEQKFSQQQLKYEKAVQRAKNRYQILEQSIEALNNDNYDISQENSKTKASVVRLKEQIASLKEDLEKEHSMSEQLKENVLQMNLQNKELNQLLSIKEKQLMTNNQTRFELKQALEQKQQIINNFDKLRLENIKLTDDQASLQADNSRLLQTVAQKDEKIRKLVERIRDIQAVGVLSQLHSVEDLSDISNRSAVKRLDQSLSQYIKASVSRLSEQAVRDYESSRGQNKLLSPERVSEGPDEEVQEDDTESDAAAEDSNGDDQPADGGLRDQQGQKKDVSQSHDQSPSQPHTNTQPQLQTHAPKQPVPPPEYEDASDEAGNHKNDTNIPNNLKNEPNNTNDNKENNAPSQELQTTVKLSTQDTYEVVTNLLQEQKQAHNNSQSLHEYSTLTNSMKHNVTAFLPPEMNTQTINGIEINQQQHQDLPQAPPLTDNLLSTNTLLKKYQNINNAFNKNNKPEDDLDLDLA